mgnify:CR=1 FL=1
MKLDDVDGDDFRIEDRRGQGGGGLGGLGSVLGGGGKGAKIGIPALIVVVIGIFLSQAGATQVLLTHPFEHTDGTPFE